MPPVPRLLRIRSAAHPDEGFDRIGFDFTGPFTPAQAHTDAGTALVSSQRRDLDYPMMRGYLLVGDFEGTCRWPSAWTTVVGYRIGELPGTPGRVYLDVAA